MGRNELVNIIKKCCDILRTDDGISGAVHYTEELSWLLYLKFFQDKEKERAGIAEINGEDYTPLIKRKYCWNEWTDPEKKRTGKELITFINEELFPYLQGLTGTQDTDPRQIIRAIFNNCTSRINSGYLLSDVIEEIKKITFESDDNMFTISHTSMRIYLKIWGKGVETLVNFIPPGHLLKQWSNY